MKQKNPLTVAFALLALNLPMAAAYAHAEHGQPQFGGVIAEAGLAQFEVVVFLDFCRRLPKYFATAVLAPRL